MTSRALEEDVGGGREGGRERERERFKVWMTAVTVCFFSPTLASSPGQCAYFTLANCRSGVFLTYVMHTAEGCMMRQQVYSSNCNTQEAMPSIPPYSCYSIVTVM